MTGDPSTERRYGIVLNEYLASRSEASLYQASLLGKVFVESGIGPDEIIAVHAEALESAVASMPYRQKAGAAVDALQFLLDVMIAYGVHHRNYLELRLAERDRSAEAEAMLARQRAEDAERADREKSDILASIAHELRTPLTAARGHIDLTLRALARGRDVESLPGQLTRARQALDRLTRMSNDLVAASRGTAPSLPLEPLEIGPILVQSCEWAQALAREKRLQLTADVDTAGARILGNADGLLTLFGNLLSNAVRYTPAGGQAQVTARAGDDTVVVQVSDTGIGMSDAVRARIFDKFYRSPDARNAESGGLGIGLTLTRQLVLAHAGRILVESELGKGSRFTVELPRLAGADANEEGSA